MHLKLYSIKIILACALVFLLNSCNSTSTLDDKKTSEELSNLNDEVVDLKDKLDFLLKKIEEVDTNRLIDNVDFIKFDEYMNFKNKYYDFKSEISTEVLDLKSQRIESKAIFNLKEKEGFSNFISNEYTFSIAVHEVKPYLAGYKVIFKIGNPYSCSFHNPKINLKWNQSKWTYYSENKNSEKNFSEILDIWEKSCKKSEQSILKELKSGVWNKIELLITPATIDQIEHVEFSMEIDTVSFMPE